jgi:hypothetical protein
LRILNFFGKTSPAGTNTLGAAAVSVLLQEQQLAAAQ